MTDDEIEISVIIPTFRRVTFLKQAVCSALKAFDTSGLTGRSEILVVDDGWDDEAHAAVGRLNKKIVRYIRTQRGPVAGPAAARNLGVKQSRGKYVYFLDDDDYYFPNRFVKSLDILRSGQWDCVLESVVREMDSKPGVTTTSGPVNGSNQLPPLEYLLLGKSGTAVWPSATAVTKEFYKKIGGMDESLRGCEDAEFFLRSSIVGRISLQSGRPVAYMRRHATNISRKRKYYVFPLVVSTLFKNVDFRHRERERDIIKAVMRNKINYALSKCREDYGYIRRIWEGSKVLRYFDWRWITFQNIKSIIVWAIYPKKK